MIDLVMTRGDENFPTTRQDILGSIPYEKVSKYFAHPTVGTEIAMGKTHDQLPVTAPNFGSGNDRGIT